MNNALIETAFHDSLRPPRNQFIDDWAEEKIVLSRLVTSQDGPYRKSTHPWQIEPMRAIQDNRNEAVVVIKGNQVGGSTLAVICLAHAVDEDPGPAMWVSASKDLIKDFSKDTLYPILRCVASIDQKALANRATAQTYELRLPSMTLVLAWGGSEMKAEQKGIRWLYLDEFEKYPELIGHFEKRTTRFFNSRKIYITAPGLDTGPGWEKYQTTDQREWQWPCLKCEQLLLLKWEGHVFWERHFIDGKPDWAKIFPTIRFVCPHCRHEHAETPALHTHIAQIGRYVALRPLANDGMQRKVVGFRFNAMILHQIEGVPCWQRMVKEYEEAMESKRRGSLLQLQTFINKRLAEPWVEGEQDIIVDKPKESVYEMANTGDEKFDFTFLTVDHQAREPFFWYMVDGWRTNGSSRRLDLGSLMTWAEVKAKQEQWKLPGNWVFIDSGWDAPTVYNRCAQFGWTAVKGEDKPFYVHHTKKGQVRRLYSEKQTIDVGLGKDTGRLYCVFFLMASPSCADIFTRLRDGKGALYELPGDINEEHLKQLHAEEKRGVIDQKTGQERWIWVKRRKRNHLFDCAKLQILGASMAKVIPVDPEDLPSEEGQK